MCPPPDEGGGTPPETADTDSRDAAEYDATDRYWIVRKAVEDALLNVFWTLALVGFGLALLVAGALAVLRGDGSQISILLGVALLGLGAGNVAAALDVPLPFAGAD